MKVRNYKPHLALLCLSLLTTACTGSGYKLPNVSSSEISKAEAEIKADDAALRIYKRSDQAYTKKIANISKKLQNSAGDLCVDAEFVPCKFEVEYSKKMTINAYAYEDYKIMVFKGMLQFLRNDDEIAALVAHEMGHHLAKHNQEALQNEQTGALVASILGAALVGVANANNQNYNYSSYQQQQDQQMIESMAKIGAKMGRVTYSKDQEREADLLAAYLLSHAGYDLGKARGLMYTLARLKSDDVKVKGKAVLLKTHPPSAERYIAWDKTLKAIEESETKLPEPVVMRKHKDLDDEIL